MAARYIATHSGRFHADDVFAAAVLLSLPKFQDHAIVRTRDEKIIAAAAVVIDVGFVYDPGNGRFDHHQANAPTSPLGEPYSALGLVWAEYGASYISRIDQNASDATCEKAAKRLATSFIRAIDLSDNGRGRPGKADIDVAMDALNSADTGDSEFQRSAFDSAVYFAKKILSGLAQQAAKIVEDTTALESLWVKVKESPELTCIGVLEIPERLNWTPFVVAINDAALSAKQPLTIHYVLQQLDNGEFGIMASPMFENRFETHKLLDPRLRGKSKAELEALMKIKDITFVHRNGFMACGSRAAMLMLARDWSVDAGTL